MQSPPIFDREFGPMTQSTEGLGAGFNATMGQADGIAVALNYGDFEGESAAMIDGEVLVDCGAQSAIIVRGVDAGMFLNGLVSNDIPNLKVGAIQPNLLCANKGKILHGLSVVRTKPEEYLVLPSGDEGDPVASHLNAYLVRESVEMGMVNLARFDLVGVRAGQALDKLGLQPGATGQTFQEATVLISPNPLGIVKRHTVLLPAAIAAPFAASLLEASPDLRLAGHEALEEVRIWAGVPGFGVDFDQDFLPGEAGLESHISHNKGCYVGQEIHARMHFRGHPNRKLAAMRLAGADAEGMAAGAELFAQGEAAGRLTSISRLARDGRYAGIGLVKYRLFTERATLATNAASSGSIEIGPVATDLGAQHS